MSAFITLRHREAHLRRGDPFICLFRLPRILRMLAMTIGYI